VRYIGGQVQLGGQTFHWGSGGGGQSIPFGTHRINIGDIGAIGRRIGSVAGLGGPGGTIWDPTLGRNRAGIQIHPNTHGSDLDRLYTAGCFSIPQNEWPRFRAALLQEASKHPGGLFLNVNRNGQAFIGARGQAQQAVNQPGGVAPQHGEPGGQGGPGRPRALELGGGGGGQQRRQPTEISNIQYAPGGETGQQQMQTGFFDPETGRVVTPHEMALQRREMALQTRLERLQRGPARETARTRGAGGEGAPLGGAPEPHERAAGEGRLGVRTGRGAQVEGAGGPHTRGAGGEGAPLGGAPPTSEARRRQAIDATQNELDDVRRRREALEHPVQPFSSMALRSRAVREQEEEERRQRRDLQHQRKEAEESGRLTSGSRWAHGLRARREGEQGDGQAQPTTDRSTIDKTIAGQVNAGNKLEGRMDVHFHNVPRNRRVTADGKGAFKDMRVSKTPEMAHTGSGTESSGQYAEE
jgi:hypothetical protein